MDARVTHVGRSVVYATMTEQLYKTVLLIVAISKHALKSEATTGLT